MHYHRRYLEDSSCEIICTRCFLTVGTASGLAAIKALESQHTCPAPASINQALPLPEQGVTDPKRNWLSRYSSGLAGLPIPLLVIAVAVLLYVIPTAIEIALSIEVGPWLASIILGDFVACAFIFAFFKMRRTGVILYLLLTISKIWLFSAHLIPASSLPWITDAVPVLIVIGKAASLRMQAQAAPRI